jgi:p-cumic alcohol dehydrogenase
MVHYIASKGAIATMTRALAKDLGVHGITVNAIAPGLVMTRRLKANPAFDDALIAQSVDIQSIPECEQPDDLIGVCLFLAGDGSRMMTGQTLTVDGGTAFN